jgi:hypothetical protein
MRIHLASIRQLYPTAPILVSKKGDEPAEMEAHRAEFDVRYWLENCNYVDALLRLLQRCETEYVCILDHDTVLLASLDPLLNGLREGRFDLVGVEERIREAPGIDWKRLAPLYNGWMRFAPGFADTNFILFNLREFLRQWGLRGVRGKRKTGTWEGEFTHGICQKLKRHKYLLPFHTGKYGRGNLLKDGDTPILWHQWFGSYRTRLGDKEPEAFEPGNSQRVASLRSAESAFLADYPHLDFSELSPAWGPGWDLAAEYAAAAKGYPGFWARGLQNVRRWYGYGLRRFARVVLAKLDRWRRLL